MNFEMSIKSYYPDKSSSMLPVIIFTPNQVQLKKFQKPLIYY